MSVKFFVLLLIGAVCVKGQAVTEIFLPDETRNWNSNELIGHSISIPKWWFDTLVSCHIVFPNGNMYEAYPNDNIPDENIMYLSATEPFNACGIGFRGIPETRSGTYELYSFVDHFDSTRSLTRQKYNINISISEVEIPRK